MNKTLTKWKTSLQIPTIVLDEGKEETTSSLPGDLIVDILSFLPVKSILRFRCVCKYWCNLFDDPNFIQTHLKNSVESRKLNCLSIKGQDNEFSMLIRNSSSLTAFECDYFESMNLMELPFIKSLRANYPQQRTFTHGSSCNGLILMENRTANGNHINLFLWNPTTKEYKEINKDYTYTPSYDDDRLMPLRYEYGLGYDCHTDDYKIVKANHVYRCYYREQYFYGYELQVYTLCSSSWKRLPNIFPYEIEFYNDAFVNGALHWIGTPCPYSTDPQPSRLIVSFDIRGENLGEVPLTPQVHELFAYDDTSKSLGVLGGCLCVVSSGSCSTEVWVMKDYKVRESWTRLFTAQIPVEKSVKYCCMTLKWDFKNGKVLFKACTGGDDYFLLYDYKSEVSKIYHIPEWRSTIETYVESLVSISGTYAGKQVLPTLRKQALSNSHKKKAKGKNRKRQATRKYHLAEKAYMEKGRFDLDIFNCD